VSGSAANLRSCFAQSSASVMSAGLRQAGSMSRKSRRFDCPREVGEPHSLLKHCFTKLSKASASTPPPQGESHRAHTRANSGKPTPRTGVDQKRRLPKELTIVAAFKLVSVSDNLGRRYAPLMARLESDV
jgi:hypothetical protein